MPETRVKYSRNGWPLSPVEHRIGELTCQPYDAERLCRCLKKRFGVDLQVTQPLTESPGHYEFRTVPVRLSMERYGQMREFVNGFKAALYG